jgi:hypothetical protein
MGLRKLKFGESEHFYHLHRETLEERNYHHRVRIACICLEHGGWAVRPKFDGWASSHAGGYTRDSSWRGYVVRRNGYGIPSEADSVVRRHVREKPCRISLSVGLCTLHLRRTSGCGLRRLDSLGEAAKIIDAVLGPLHDRLFPRYVLRAIRFRRTLIRSRDRQLPFHDLMRLYRWGGRLALAGIVMGIIGCFRRNTLRWYASICSVATGLCTKFAWPSQGSNRSRTRSRTGPIGPIVVQTRRYLPNTEWAPGSAAC